MKYHNDNWPREYIICCSYLFVPHGKCIGLNPDFLGIWIQKKIWKGSLLADQTQCPVGILRIRTGFVHPGMICLDIFNGRPATRQWGSMAQWFSLGFCWDELVMGSPKPARKKSHRVTSVWCLQVPQKIVILLLTLAHAISLWPIFLQHPNFGWAKNPIPSQLDWHGVSMRISRFCYNQFSWYSH
jgi:hypothetical protein